MREYHIELMKLYKIVQKELLIIDKEAILYAQGGTLLGAARDGKIIL
jgi:hypothetical protein